MKVVTLRCSDEEYEILSQYCKRKERSLNDILRELVRSLDSAR
ncbi:ribbon-helix-helix protein, CopG family [Phormidesmis priestleyi ULC007]|uniref:Ribbon-helix-helix protein, CopG family n=1 Tax=Phormidesmis priestleyi ULC007 TaxID=1920490 RepID=A0A2T1D2H3_9CYAN|nr:ribbon-helix-helix protein, CopG family [Phormidesmis priestleyi ULC007]